VAPVGTSAGRLAYLARYIVGNLRLEGTAGPPQDNRQGRGVQGVTMVKFLVWCLLLVFCWPLAVLAIVLYPLVWLLLLPFRLIGIAVDGALQAVSAVIFLPARILRAI
jgi:hypothetical protein